MSEMPVSADVTRAPTPVEGIHEELKASSSSPASTNSKEDEEAVAQSATPTLSPPTFAQRIMKRLRPFSVVVTPVTITLAISLPIALIDPLKALFVDISAQGGPAFFGPDNRPPLAFMIDTGALVQPLSLGLISDMPVFPSSIPRRHHRPARAHPPRCQLLAHRACPPALAPAADGDVHVHYGQDGRAPRHWRVPRSGYDELGLRRPEGDHAPVCADVPQWDADGGQVSPHQSVIHITWDSCPDSQLIVASLYAPEGKTNTLAVCNLSHTNIL